MFKAQPLTLCSHDVDCADMVVLSDKTTRETVRVELEEMACAWEEMASIGRDPPSWRIADQLVAAGAAAI